MLLVLARCPNQVAPLHWRAAYLTFSMARSLGRRKKMRKQKNVGRKNGFEIQNLENRLMMAVTPLTLAFSRGLLTITGSTVDNQINVRHVGNSWTISDGSWSVTKTLAVTSLSVNGKAGNDTITIDSSVTCPATLIGDLGNDTLIASSGNTSLNGGAGDDSLTAGSGNDKLYGAAGNDTLVGGSGNDFIQGGLGNDSMSGGAGVNALDYSDHTATQGVTVHLDGSGTDGMTGETDTITAEFQIVNGSAGNDSITGTSANESINGNAGNDTLIGADGDDSLNGGAGNDSLAGGEGNNALIGLAGNDTLVSGSGNDSLDGGDGNDSLDGGDGNNKLLGGAGNDLLTSGAGNDSLDGGAGNDTLVGGDGADSLYGQAGNDSLSGGNGDDDLYGGVGTDSLDGGDGDDVLITIGGAANSTLSGENGNDTFWCDSAITETIIDASADEISAGAVHRVDAFQNEKGQKISKDLTGQAIVDPTLLGASVKYRNFKNDPLFASGGPSINDINQGQLGDCYFLSQLGSFAELDPTMIKQSIVALGDGTYAVQYVKNGKDDFYRVDADLPSYSTSQLSYAGFGAQNSIWAALFEKAWTFARTTAGTYASIASGWMGSVASAFGKNNDFGYTNGDPTALVTTLENAVNAGKSVTVGTYGTQPGGSIIVGGHAYSIEHITDDGAGNVTLTVRNPWGVDGYTSVDGSNDGYVTVSLAQFTASMQDYCISDA
jgi:Ca2+-binding RTX toxin-like protein